jgi:hypothetical protein
LRALGFAAARPDDLLDGYREAIKRLFDLADCFRKIDGEDRGSMAREFKLVSAFPERLKH